MYVTQCMFHPILHDMWEAMNVMYMQNLSVKIKATQQLKWGGR